MLRQVVRVDVNQRFGGHAASIFRFDMRDEGDVSAATMQPPNFKPEDGGCTASET